MASYRRMDTVSAIKLGSVLSPHICTSLPVPFFTLVGSFQLHVGCACCHGHLSTYSVSSTFISLMSEDEYLQVASSDQSLKPNVKNTHKHKHIYVYIRTRVEFGSGGQV